MDWDTMGKRVRTFHCAVLGSPTTEQPAYTHINSKCPKGLQELSDIIPFLCPPVVTPWGPLFSSCTYTLSAILCHPAAAPCECMCQSHRPRRRRRTTSLFLVDGIFGAHFCWHFGPTLLLSFRPSTRPASFLAQKAYSNDGFLQNAIFNGFCVLIKLWN